MSPSNGKQSPSRRQFTPEEKATILRRHLADRIPVSDPCDEYHSQPTLFYLRQWQAFEQLSGRWVPPDLRDAVVAFVATFGARTGLAPTGCSHGWPWRPPGSIAGARATARGPCPTARRRAPGGSRPSSGRPSCSITPPNRWTGTAD